MSSEAKSTELRSYEVSPGLLDDRNILITGASDGIGKVLAVTAASLGARVIVHGRNKRKLEAVYDEIAALDGAPAPSIALMDLATADGDAYSSLAESIADEFGRRCLLARRLSERGVRFVQATHGPDLKWDHHDGLLAELPRSAQEVDKPIAGLIRDLKSRGMLDETLVLWSGEFGRTPGSEHGRRKGRDHNPHGFTIFMAGGGVRPGISYGQTDDYGYYATEDKVHLHDLHATLLHLLGVDHTCLTYRFQGQDIRLTDLEGELVHGVIA